MYIQVQFYSFLFFFLEQTTPLLVSAAGQLEPLSTSMLLWLLGLFISLKQKESINVENL